jgi:acyl-ACP thioesterase
MLDFPFGVYDFTVKSYHTNQNGKLTLPTILHFLQECAWDNARVNMFGFEDLEKENAFWVLSKIYLEIDEYPNWKDEIQIKTWPKGIDGLFAIRDFQIFRNKEVIGNATSYWLILDKTNGRPKRLENFNFLHDNFLKESAISQKLGKLTFNGSSTIQDQRKVYSSDLDINKHVNNATYVRWILDSYFSENKELIKEFEINFLTELKLNEEFTVNSILDEEEKIYIIKNTSDKEICRARLKI